jgi:hypothetical protein
MNNTQLVTIDINSKSIENITFRSDVFDAIIDLFQKPQLGCVAIVDGILKIACKFPLKFEWAEDRCQLQILNSDQQTKMPIRKSTFRAIIARVATIASEKSFLAFNPSVGDENFSIGADVDIGLAARFENSPDRQMLELLPSV